MKTIYQFKQGDEIVRVEAAKPFGVVIDGISIRDRSYIGEKFIFHGIANAMIYLKHPTSASVFVSSEGFTELSLDNWDEGWNDWVDPKKITRSHIPKYLLEKKLEDALDEENYEFADELKKLLDYD
tara:strand:+ start:8518 stop:8895 length:378 start_codon:yes stop_codon:yes gene_type:complete